MTYTSEYMKDHMYLTYLNCGERYDSKTGLISSQWLDSSVGRALHRYRRCHGLKSRSGLSPQLKCMIFHIFTYILHHLRVYCDLTM